MHDIELFYARRVYDLRPIEQFTITDDDEFPPAVAIVWRGLHIVLLPTAVGEMLDVEINAFHHGKALYSGVLSAKPTETLDS